MLIEDKPNHFETIIKLVIVIAVTSLVFVSPVYLYYNYGLEGLLMYGVIVLLLSPSIAFTYKKFVFFKKNEIKKAFTSKNTHVVSILVFNVVVFFMIGMATLIEPIFLILAYLITCFPVYLFIKKRKITYQLALISCLVVSSFLTTNFFIVSNKKIETYRYYFFSGTSSIYLFDDVYSQYPGIRIFFFNDKVSSSGRIQYTFYEGCFGFRVMKDYKI